jgi:hypothetical protein
MTNSGSVTGDIAAMGAHLNRQAGSAVSHEVEQAVKQSVEFPVDWALDSVDRAFQEAVKTAVREWLMTPRI